jgi:hypothetical protein
MIRLLLKKQICMEGGCMLDNMLLQIIMLIGGMFGVMLGFYIVLCFIDWVDRVVTERRWKEWV